MKVSLPAPGVPLSTPRDARQSAVPPSDMPRLTAGPRGGHVHHWLVESPNGAPEVRARCRDCPGQRRYPASVEDGNVFSYKGDPMFQGPPYVFRRKR